MQGCSAGPAHQLAMPCAGHNWSFILNTVLPSGLPSSTRGAFPEPLALLVLLFGKMTLPQANSYPNHSCCSVEGFNRCQCGAERHVLVCACHFWACLGWASWRIAMAPLGNGCMPTTRLGWAALCGRAATMMVWGRGWLQGGLGHSSGGTWLF